MVNFNISDKEKSLIKELAKATLYEAVKYNKKPALSLEELPEIFTHKLGAFVTLNAENKLRGCIGRFEPDQALYNTIIDMTIAASRYDTRFNPVSETELPNIDIEISILTPRVKIDSVDDIIVGKHGIYIEYKEKSGTYLPQVAADMHWNAEEFFQSCCVEKAGISPRECPNATLYVYEAIVF